MLSRPQLRLISLLALFFAVAQATWLDENIYGRENERRQLASDLSDAISQATGILGTGADSSSSSTTSATTTPPSSTSSPSSTPSSTPPSSTPSSSTSVTSSSTTSTPETTPPTSTSSQPPSTTPTSTTSEKSTTTKASSKTTSPPSVALVTLVSTVSGKVITTVSSSTATTSSSKSTGTASLNQDGKSSSGMSSKTKTTVIGVVVGIGGAIVLAGLFVVAWRIWGRKKNTEESDGLMGFGNGSPRHEKSSSISGSGAPTPFQSTLENYHNPARNGNVNASSNF